MCGVLCVGVGVLVEREAQLGVVSWFIRLFYRLANGLMVMKGVGWVLEAKFG